MLKSAARIKSLTLLSDDTFKKKLDLTAQSILTMPILEGLDGTNKMSKSLNNHIAILDPPNDMFGKCMSIPDELIIRYLSLLTNMDTNQMLKKLSPQSKTVTTQGILK